MRMVNFTHDSMTNVMTDFPIITLPFVNSNIPESPVLVSQLIPSARVDVRNMTISQPYTVSYIVCKLGQKSLETLHI